MHRRYYSYIYLYNADADKKSPARQNMGEGKIPTVGITISVNTTVLSPTRNIKLNQMENGSNTKEYAVEERHDERMLGSVDYARRSRARKSAERALRAVVYARVSTKEQSSEEKSSVPAQLEKCHLCIQTKKWSFVREYKDEGISGHLTIERHGLQEMLRDGREKKFDLIVVKDYDRFARNKDAAGILRQELKKLGIQVYALNTPVEPKSITKYDPDEDDSLTIMETISDMRADLERKQIRRRMKDGKDGIAKAGNLPNRVPYGYRVIRYIEGTKMRRRIEIDEEASSRVRHIFTEYTSGKGDRKIAIGMNDHGWRSPQGSEWTTRGVKYILGNAIYTGRVLWGWRHAKYAITKDWIERGKMGYAGPGNHEAIINDVTFEKAQEIRQGRTTGARGGAGRSHGVLTGIAKCIRCGSGVGYQKRYHTRSKKNENWKDTITFEYICTGYKYRGKCSQRVMSAIKLEGAVIDHIKNLYAHPKVQEKIIYDGKDPASIDNEKEIARLAREIAILPEKEKRHTEAYEKGLQTLDQYQENLARLRAESKKNHMERDNLLTLCSLTAQKSDVVQKLVTSMHDFDTFWGALQLDEKKLIIRSIISEIRAGDGRVEVDFIL